MNDNKTSKTLVSLISDVDGSISSKRIITFACVLAILVTWYVNLFYKLSVEEFIFQGLMYITGIGLGVITAEKFSRKSHRIPHHYEPDCDTVLDGDTDARAENPDTESDETP